MEGINREKKYINWKNTGRNILRTNDNTGNIMEGKDEVRKQMK